MKRKILIIGNLGYIGTMLSDHIRSKYKKNYIIGYDSGIFKKYYFGKKIRKKTIDLQVFGDVRKFDYNILKDIEHVIYLAAVSNDPMGNKYIKPTLKEKKVMQIKDIRIECNTCKVYFTPSNERSKTLMETQGHISKCKTCFEEGGE